MSRRSSARKIALHADGFNKGQIRPHELYATVPQEMHRVVKALEPGRGGLDEAFVVPLDHGQALRMSRSVKQSGSGQCPRDPCRVRICT
jgi:hypothetical protein